jgi:hypothetical protein
VTCVVSRLLYIRAFSAGAYLNFDLAYPSDAIPDDFFPSDKATYGYTVRLLALEPPRHADIIGLSIQDFGVWNITYESVSCLKNWAGAHNKAALGSVADLGTGVCCPDDPTVRLIIVHRPIHRMNPRPFPRGVPIIPVLRSRTRAVHRRMYF